MCGIELEDLPEYACLSTIQLMPSGHVQDGLGG